MRPAERRAKLYTQKDRPQVELLDPNSFEIKKWLTVANHLNGGLDDKAEFEDYLDNHIAKYDKIYFIHDKHRQFESGVGPMCIIGVYVRGQNQEPHVEWFPWASPRNKLRCAVSFFMLHRRKGTGNMIVFALNDAKRFYDHLGSYVPLFQAGKIPDGDPYGRGDEYRYFIQGKG